MGHPGRPRRRNKIIPPNSQQQPVPQARQPIKEPMVLLHDEADLISFRSDALHRFTTNQEYLENVTSKHIHSSKVIPPSQFPTTSKHEDTSEEELRTVAQNLKPDELYFGDLKLMKLKNQQLVEEIDKLKQVPSQYTIDNDKEYTYRRDHIDKLANLQAKLGTNASFEELETELSKTLEAYETEFNKKYTSMPSVHKHSQNINDLTHDPVNVLRAPDNYNPRLISSLVSINNNPVGNPEDNADVFGENVNFDGDRNGMAFMENFPQQNQPGDFNPNTGPGISNNFAMNMVANNNNVNDNDNTNDNNDSNNDDIDHLFNDGDNNNQEMGDIDDLIDFQQADNEIMGGADFDQDFLSQIDHSME